MGLAVVFQALPVHAVEIAGMRSWTAPDSTRIVFDLSDRAEYRYFVLERPWRLVIDFKNGRLKGRLALPGGGLIRRVRSSRRHSHDLRVVFDLKARPEIKAFQLPPTAAYGHRFVIDLNLPKKAVKAAKGPSSSRIKGPPARLRDVVVAIDAGHGGEDPGATGRHGIHEKDVVLAIARRLARRIDRAPGMRAFLIRDGDYYISLRERTRRARKAHADLFVSIHADSFRSRRVRGASVYILSPNGATDEMSRLLAERENGADLIGGISLEDKDDMLASVLLDLSQNAAIEASYEAASDVIKAFRPVLRLHKKEVQRAGFVVLKSPDMPSMLVETAFITNPDDERRLNSPREQERIAGALFKGIHRFFQQRPPERTLFAARQHIIGPGDTLSEIAAQYHVSIGRLRTVNGLKGDRIRVGQVIRIPVLNSDG